LAADLDPAGINPSASVPFQEWVTARSAVMSYEGTIAAIRNYGLTFVAGLLTAQGLISFTAENTTGFVPALVKLGILLASLVLIASLCVFEKTCSILQSSAIARARILERRLSMSLTDDMVGVNRQLKRTRYVIALYSAFVLVTVLLGCFILTSAGFGWGWPPVLLIIAGAATLGVIIALENPDDTLFVDWDVNPLCCRAGEPVTITFTNLGPYDVSFHTGAVAWKVKDSSNRELQGQSRAMHHWGQEADDLPIPPGCERRWTWHTPSGHSGRFTLWYTTRWGRPKSEEAPVDVLKKMLKTDEAPVKVLNREPRTIVAPATGDLLWKYPGGPEFLPLPRQIVLK